MLRIDLSRTLGGVLGRQELEDQVARRTADLQAEVATRRLAEAHLHQMNSELEQSVMQDSLTRIPNRAAFQRHLRLYVQAAPQGQELTLLFIDVDYFKKYNDHYGHLMGDAALCTVASCLSRSVLYPQDLACRWGGEEFAVILPGSGAEAATVVAERFVNLLATEAISHAASTVSSLLTASIGMAVTVSSPDLNTADLIEYADEALYAAKALGRNRIERRDPLLWPVRQSGHTVTAPRTSP
jgi:diguanylate cyclase (GGDEF)-like protein